MTAAPPEIIGATVRRSSPPEIIQTAGAPENVRAYQIAGAAAERTGAPQGKHSTERPHIIQNAAESAGESRSAAYLHRYRTPCRSAHDRRRTRPRRKREAAAADRAGLDTDR